MLSGTRGDLEGARVSVFYAGCIWQRVTRGKGDPEGGGIPGRHREPHPRRGQPGPGSAVTQNTSGTVVPTSPPALCRFGKHLLCQKPAQSGFHDRKRTLGSLRSPLAAPGAAGRGRRARRTAPAPAGRAGGRPRSPAPSRSPWQRARGGRGRAAAAAISAASCSSRPRRHGNRVTQLGRLPARLARVTPATRAPSSPSRTLPGARGRQGGRLMGDAY